MGSQVLSRMAATKSPINQGILIFGRLPGVWLAGVRLLRKISAATSDTGMIQRARASLTVVAI